MKFSQDISICIPQTPNHLTKEELIKIFTQIGFIERIDINENFNKNRVFIHFKRLYDSSYVDNIKQKLLLEKNVKLIYRFPNFLKCFISNIPKHPRYISFKEKKELFMYQSQKE